MENSVHTFCTIITNNYLPYANTLLSSIRKFNSNINFNVLFSNLSDSGEIKPPSNDGHTYYHFTNDICQSGVGKQIFDKYSGYNLDAFRWSMKPVFLNYLIRKKKYEKVIYVDCDIFFFNDFLFLFDMLDCFDAILSPHWRSRDPFIDPQNFHCLFTDGGFNGGFVGFQSRATAILDWWAKACAYSCTKDKSMGLFDDQKYLDILPAMFDNIGIVKHRGCNVANWNMLECKRVINANGEVRINGTEPIIFIHFTESTIKGILCGKDEKLQSFLDIYSLSLKSLDQQIDIINKYKQLLTSSATISNHKMSYFKRMVRKIKRLIQ